VALFSPDPQQIKLLDPLVTSPALLMTPAPGNFLYEFLDSFGLFRIWFLCLLGLGFHLNAASGKVSWTKAMVVVFGLYLGWALAAAAVLAALS